MRVQSEVESDVLKKAGESMQSSEQVVKIRRRISAFQARSYPKAVCLYSWKLCLDLGTQQPVA